MLFQTLFRHVYNRRAVKFYYMKHGKFLSVFTTEIKRMILCHLPVTNKKMLRGQIVFDKMLIKPATQFHMYLHILFASAKVHFSSTDGVHLVCHEAQREPRKLTLSIITIQTCISWVQGVIEMSQQSFCLCVHLF